MVGGESHLAVHNGASVHPADVMINHDCRAAGIEGGIHGDGDRGRVTLGISGNLDVIGTVGSIAIGGVAHNCRCRHTGDTIGNHSDSVGAGNDIVQRHRDGAGNHVGQGRPELGVGGIGNTARLDIVQTVCRVSVNLYIIAGDFKHGHSQVRFHSGGCIGGAVVAHEAGVHVGEVQSFFLIIRAVALRNIDGITLAVINRRAALGIQPAIAVVVTEQVDDVQTGSSGIVHGIEEVMGISAVTCGSSPHGVVQRNMTNNKNRLTETGSQLFIQVATQISGTGLCLRIGAVFMPAKHVLIDDIDTISALGMVMGTGNRQVGTIHSGVRVMVALNINLIGIFHIRIRSINQALQGCLIIDYRGGIGHGIVIVISRKQEAIGRGIACSRDLRKDCGYRVRTKVRGCRALEVRAGNHDDRVGGCCLGRECEGRCHRPYHTHYQHKCQQPLEMSCFHFSFSSPLIKDVHCTKAFVCKPGIRKGIHRGSIICVNTSAYTISD